jgi:hypothetical protein
MALTAVAIAAALLAPAPASVAQDLGYRGTLTADIPAMDAEFQGQSAIHEGGLHFVYVATSEPETYVRDGEAGNLEALPLVFRYRIALEAAGWTVLGAGGGGNPFGSSGGATLTAEHADGRYLRLDAGHPGVQHLDHAPSVSTFVDACVWPQPPSDDTCHPSRWIDKAEDDAPTAAHAGALAGLTAGIPAPAGAEFRSDSVVPGGGRHFYYLTPAAHVDVYRAYAADLSAAGWTMIEGRSRGEPSAGVVTASASDGSRYLQLHIGGGPISHIDVCVWPAQPAEAHCPQSAND